MVQFMGLTPEGLLPETARGDVLVDVDERIAPVNKRVENIESAVVNVKSFGAIGDGVVDDTAAINAAIQSLPANGGTVRIPAGTYKISDNIISRNALGVVGDGSSSTVIWQTNTTKHGLLCNDQLYLTITGLAFTGPTTGTGIGINLMRTNNDASNYISLSDVRLRTWGRDGIAGSNVIVSTWNNVIAVQNGRHGFNLWGTSGVSTSISFNACYANENKANGFQLANSTYVSMSGCASEKNQVDYALTQCEGVSLSGCGSEQAAVNSMVITGGQGINVNGWIYDRKGEGIRVKGNAKGVVLNVAETAGATLAGPSLAVEAGSEYFDLDSTFKGVVQNLGTETRSRTTAAQVAPIADRVNALAAPVSRGIVTDGQISSTSPDIRTQLQGALDAAANGSAGTYWGFLNRVGQTVVLAPGVYRVSARPDGMPSLVVPRGVTLDFSQATIAFEYPTTATTNWAGILAHSRAGLVIGKMVPRGNTPDGAQVYDAIRAYHTDNGNHYRGVANSSISNFQGAAFRLLGCYVTHVTDLEVAFCSHGIVHGHSNGLVPDGTAPYEIPVTAEQATGSSRRPTDLFVNSVTFVGVRGDVIVDGAIGSKTQPNALDWSNKSVTGGNLYLTDVMFEDTPARAVWARELSQVSFRNVHLEETGAPGGAMVDLDVVYGNVSFQGIRINITGGRDLRDIQGNLTRATPAGLFQLGGFQSFNLADVYLLNQLGDLYLSGPEPWEGAWGERSRSGIAVDQAATGALLDSGLFPGDNNWRGTYSSNAADSKTARTGAFNVTTPEFGADPTGSVDSTKAIQDAVNKAAAGGQGAVYIPAGKYKVSPPFIEMKPETLIHGDGDSTIIFVDATITPPTEKIGVFHIGSYNNRAQDPTMYRASLRDLMIKTADGSQAHQPAVPNVCGVIFNTDLGSATHDPDAVHSIRGLTIWDMHIGMAILGRDDQGMKISDVRIRGGEQMGLLVGKPSDHPEAIAGVSGGPGAADNKFLNMDVSSSNKLGGVHAGIEIYTSNSKFVNSTSWYNRRFGSFAGTKGAGRGTYYDGAGWYVKGTKNVFVSCTAQENGGHGFITQYPGCQFIGCIAESNSWHDSVKGDARVNEASGFFVCNGATDTQIISARSNNARGADKGQVHGYVLENYAKNQWVQGTADQNFSSAVKFGTNMASLGKDVVVRVGDTTLNWAAGPLSTSATDEVRALAKEATGGDPRITEAIRLTETAKTSEAAYRQAVAEAQQAAAGNTIYQTSFEDTTEWTPSFGSWVYSDAVLAANGSRMARLPANNTNTGNGKPVHMYGKTDVPVLRGRKYMIRAKLRTMGAPGDTDTFQVLLAKASGTTQIFWLISTKVGLKTSGVGQDGWTDVEIPWTATETATLRLGPQGSFLAADLLVDQMVFADVTDVQDLTGPVNTAREKWDADEAAAVEAWSAIMPTTAIGSGGGGTVTVTRAEYDQLARTGKVDPNVTYLVTL